MQMHGVTCALEIDHDCRDQRPSGTCFSSTGGIGPDIGNKELQHPTITIGFSTPRGHPHLRFVGGTGPGLRRWATCMAHNCSWLVFKDGFHPMRGRRVVGGCAARPCSLHWSVSPPPHDFGAALRSMNGSGRWRVAEAEWI